MNECEDKESAHYFLHHMTDDEFAKMFSVNIECTTSPKEPHQFNMIKYFEDIGIKK